MLSSIVIGGIVVVSAAAYTPPIKPVYNETYCKNNGTVEFPEIIPLSELTTVFSDPSGTQNPEDYVQIRNTAMLYPLHMDGKNFDLGDLFTDNVVANLSQGPIVNGLPALEGALQASLAAVTSHHDLGTQYINIADSGCTAASITYFHASLLGVGPSYGQIVYALGQYQDSWVKLSAGWRIANRNLVYMAPFIGNASIVEG